MASKKSGFCSSCGARLLGIGYEFNGKILCYDCYQKAVSEVKMQEQEKQDLIQYISQLTGLSLDESIYGVINRGLSEGKTINGMKATIWFWCSIEGQTIRSQQLIYGVIRDQYESAREYLKRQKELRKINDGISLEVTPIQVKIPKEKVQNKKKHHIGYNIEDL